MNFNLLLKEKRYEEIPAGGSGIPAEEDTLWVIKVSDTFRSFERRELFFLGSDGDITLTDTGLLIKIEGNVLEATGGLENEFVYWNQRRLLANTVKILRGDSLLIGQVKVVFYSDHLRIYGEESRYQCLLSPLEKTDLPYQGFPDYKRSPRIAKRILPVKIEIKAPPAKVVPEKGGLAAVILPPLATTAVTIGVGLMMGRGSYLLMSAATTVITIMVSVIRFFSERRERKEKNLKNREVYEAYLLKKRMAIYHAHEKETEAYRYNYPEIGELSHMVHSYDSRIYERMATDKDFLVFSVGKQHGPGAVASDQYRQNIKCRQSAYQWCKGCLLFRLSPHLWGGKPVSVLGRDFAAAGEGILQCKLRLPVGGTINLELFARNLGVLNHVLGTISRITETQKT